MEVEKRSGVGGSEEKKRCDVKREKVLMEVSEVVEEMTGVRREGVVILVFGAKNDHHQWNGIGVGENHGGLERVVVVHEIVIAYIQNHLAGVLLHFTHLIHTNTNHTLLNTLLQVFGKYILNAIR